jgi:hypothetical protein
MVVARQLAKWTAACGVTRQPLRKPVEPAVAATANQCTTENKFIQSPHMNHQLSPDRHCLQQCMPCAARPLTCFWRVAALTNACSSGGRCSPAAWRAAAPLAMPPLVLAAAGCAAVRVFGFWFSAWQTEQCDLNCTLESELLRDITSKPQHLFLHGACETCVCH